MKKFLNLPSEIVETVEAEGLFLIKGGIEVPKQANNQGQMCVGVNNQGGQCTGINNQGTMCQGG